MIASLPMYWRPETAPLWVAFWEQVQATARAHGATLPDLTPPDAIPDLYAHWLSPDLALSMTCGQPFRSTLKDRVTYIGTLGFGLEAPDGHYFSQIISRHDPRDLPLSDTASLRLAYNSADSQSGWAVTQHATPFRQRPVFTEFLETGSHAASLAAVAEGRADIAYIDAVTWRLLTRFDPNAGAVFDAGRTLTTPGLPLIAALGTDPAPLRAALMDATLGWSSPDPMAMGGPLSFHVLDPAQYHDIPLPSPPPNRADGAEMG